MAQLNGIIAAHREVPSLDIEQTIITSDPLMLNGSVPMGPLG